MWPSPSYFCRLLILNILFSSLFRELLFVFSLGWHLAISDTSLLGSVQFSLITLNMLCLMSAETQEEVEA